MKFCSFVLALFTAASVSFGQSVATNDAALWRPRFATPAIVALDTASNRQFTAEVKASRSVKNWSVSIANDLKAWPCKIVSAKYSTINRETEPGWRVQISVPTDASPELFALTISNSEWVSVQKQSVSIVPAF